MTSIPSELGRPKVSPFYNPKVRGFVFQAALFAVLAVVAYFAIANTRDNMNAHHLPTDFGFWTNTAGFDINQHLISYSALSTYGAAFWVGLLNTLLVAIIGCVLTTMLGFTIGIARLSSNFIVAKAALVYVETLRNIPLLLQLLFWYNAVLKPLPAPRQSIALPGSVFLNNRGVYIPNPIFGPEAEWIGVVAIVGVILAFLYRAYAHRLQVKTGRQSPVLAVAAGLVIGLPLLVFFLLGSPVTFDLPQLRGFNYSGGLQIYPEFVTLLIGLVLYTASFIAEIVRAGIMSVPKGQTEAAHALGLKQTSTLDLVVVPQAMRVIIPPLTSQYLNLVKNSSLAVFIGYPDLVQIFAGTVLNQTGAAVQVMAITMAVYLVISLVTSFGMNIYNQRKTLTER